MPLTDQNLKQERPNGSIGGVQRLYEFKGGWGLSLINSPMAHSYRYAWEAAVLSPDGSLNYKTPLTCDVEVFMSDEEANEFIERAAAYLEALTPEQTALLTETQAQERARLNAALESFAKKAK